MSHLALMTLILKWSTRKEDSFLSISRLFIFFPSNTSTSQGTRFQREEATTGWTVKLCWNSEIHHKRIRTIYIYAVWCHQSNVQVAHCYCFCLTSRKWQVRSPTNRKIFSYNFNLLSSKYFNKVPLA